MQNKVVGQLESGFANLSGSKYNSTLHTARREVSDVTYGTIDKATAGGKSCQYAALAFRHSSHEFME
jgi:hypothetical protein